MLLYTLSLKLQTIILYKYNHFMLQYSRSSSRLSFSVHPVSKESQSRPRTGQSWAPSWALPQASLNWSETSPASFPAAKTLLQTYLDFTKSWKLLSAEPWLQEKSAIKALWLQLVSTSKAQLLVYLISFPMYRHPQMPKSHWDILFLLPGPAVSHLVPLEMSPCHSAQGACFVLRQVRVFSCWD